MQTIFDQVLNVHFFTKFSEVLQHRLCRYLELHTAQKDGMIIREGKGPDPGPKHLVTAVLCLLTDTAARVDCLYVQQAKTHEDFTS